VVGFNAKMHAFGIGERRLKQLRPGFRSGRFRVRHRAASNAVQLHISPPNGAHPSSSWAASTCPHMQRDSLIDAPRTRPLLGERGRSLILIVVIKIGG
jgi:hypothetical protein